VENPIEIRLAGQADIGTLNGEDQIHTLRALAAQVKTILRAVPQAARVRDDWDQESFVVKLRVDADRAQLAGVSNLDVAESSTAAMSGIPVTTLREGDKQIPVVARLRLEERAQLADVQSLYIYASQDTNKVPLQAISSIEHSLETQQIRRRDHFRTISVKAFPVPGALASFVLDLKIVKWKTVGTHSPAAAIASEPAN